MSGKKIASTSGFVIDENGKFQLVPLKPSKELLLPQSACKSSDKGKSVKRKHIAIKPIGLQLDFYDSAFKKPRPEKSAVCKELFRAPPKKRSSSLSILAGKNIHKTQNKKAPPEFKKTRQSVQPSLQSDKFEENKENFKLEKYKKRPHSIVLNVPSIDTEKQSMHFIKTPKSQRSQLNTPLQDIAEMNESVSEKSFILNEITTWIQQEKEDFEIYQRRHHERMQKLEELLRQYGNHSALTELTNTANKRVISSPGNVKSVDLRKMAINNNFRDNGQYELQSPRTRKAATLYNSFRFDYSVLCTPKFETTSIKHCQDGIANSLSKRIQKQCLLLQDTPK